MCGIAGIVNFTGRPVEHGQIKAMTDVLSHRGPDGEGQFLDGALGLGHRRLAILDLTEAGHQPMQSTDHRYILTYNGEIYNFKELRQELEKLGHKFTSHTDTEVVLQAFAAWGRDCVLKFNGMFAFAIWDKQEQQLFIARDRYGIKPFYYHKTDRNFVFASEVKAFEASGLYHHELDKEGLVEYLTFQNFFTHHTLFKDIHMLMPGHYAVLDRQGKMTTQKYWDFDFSKKIIASKEELIEETDRLFQQAVKRQLVSDVPVNSYLSGGIDSGAITVVASKMMPHMRSFTVGFDLSSASGLELSFDERAKAEHISYLAGTEQYEMVLKAGDMERCMDQYVWHLEEPRVGQSYPNYYAAKLASKFGKVVLSGAGGDELFGGYPWRYLYQDKDISFTDFIDQYYLKWQRLIPNAQLHELLAPIWDDVKHVWTRDIFADVFNPIKKDTFTPDEAINASLYLEAKTFLHGLLVVEDKLSMAHSLETRVPFLDNDLVDFAMQVPNEFKISEHVGPTNENDLASKKQANRSGKLILRETLKKHLDDEVANAKKQGFSSPDASWFRGESIDFVKKEFSDLPPFFSAEVVQQMLDEHVSGKQNRRLAIWSLLYLTKISKETVKEWKQAA